MDKTPPTRRGILSLLGVGLSAGLAGCNSLTDTESSPDGSEQNENSTNGNPDISVSISTETEPSQLPSIWNDHSIEDFQAEFTVETGGQPSSVSVSNRKVDINQDSEQWNDDSVTVQPGQMTSGEQEFTATAEKSGTTATDATQASKPAPGNYKLDIVPERNEELRQTIENNSDEENYLEDRGGFIEQDPVFDTYSSHKHVRFDKVGADLTALEWRHDNDYEELSSNPETDPNVNTTQFVRSMNTDTGNPEIERVKNNPILRPYPNSSGGRDPGQWDYEQFSSSNTLGEALDWLHPYLFNWQQMMTEGPPISSEDVIYAPALEQSLEQHTDIEAHAWDFDLDEHGNGLIYGKNPDGTEKLRVMETVAAPLTSSYNAPIEQSDYLTPGTEGFNAYWHPLRFGWEQHSNSKRWDFRGEKERALVAVINIASSDLSGTAEIRRRNGVVPTTEYLKDFTEKLRTYNENASNFSQLHNQSKLLRKLAYRNEHQYVVFGTTANPQYAAVKDFGIVDEIWVDQNGQYDDFDQYLREHPVTWRPTCLEDGSLRFEADSDYLTPAQNEEGKTLEFTLQNQTDCWVTIKPYLWGIEQQTENGWTTVANGENDRERVLDPSDEHRWYLSFQEYPGGGSGETHFVVSLDPGTYRLSITVELDSQETTKHVPFEIGN